MVAQASGGRIGVRLADELQPDVVLMDVRMPDLEGPEATREILERHPSTRVVALTVVSDDADVAAVVEAGACGFLAKDTPIEGVVLAVRAAAQGVAWLSPRAAEVVLGRVRRNGLEPEPDPGPIEQLSARELEVLRLIAPRHGERRDRARPWASVRARPRTTSRTSSPSSGCRAASRPRSTRSAAA